MEEERKREIKTLSVPPQSQLFGKESVVNICQILPKASFAKIFSFVLFKYTENENYNLYRLYMGMILQKFNQQADTQEKPQIYIKRLTNKFMSKINVKYLREV